MNAQDIIARSQRCRERSVETLGVAPHRDGSTRVWARVRRCVLLTRGADVDRVDELNAVVLGRAQGDDRLWAAYRARRGDMGEGSALTLALAEQLEEDEGVPDTVDVTEVVF